MKSFILEPAITSQPLVELLFLSILEAVRRFLEKCVVVFFLTREADFLAEIEVGLDIESDEVHALQRVKELYRTISRYWSLRIRVSTVKGQCRYLSGLVTAAQERARRRNLGTDSQ